VTSGNSLYGATSRQVIFRHRTLGAEAFDPDGYFLTGDLGSIEIDGRIRFRGRLKEMIKTGGANVAPLEVEEVLLRSIPTQCRLTSWACCRIRFGGLEP